MASEGGKGNGGTAFPAVGAAGIRRASACVALPRPLRAPPGREGGTLPRGVVAVGVLDRGLSRLRGFVWLLAGVAVSKAVLVFLLARLRAVATWLGALPFLFLWLLFTQVPRRDVLRTRFSFAI